MSVPDVIIPSSEEDPHQHNENDTSSPLKNPKKRQRVEEEGDESSSSLSPKNNNNIPSDVSSLPTKKVTTLVDASSMAAESSSTTVEIPKILAANNSNNISKKRSDESDEEFEVESGSDDGVSDSDGGSVADQPQAVDDVDAAAGNAGIIVGQISDSTINTKSTFRIAEEALMREKEEQEQERIDIDRKRLLKESETSQIVSTVIVPPPTSATPAQQQQKKQSQTNVIIPISSMRQPRVRPAKVFTLDNGNPNNPPIVARFSFVCVGELESLCKTFPNALRLYAGQGIKNVKKKANKNNNPSAANNALDIQDDSANKDQDEFCSEILITILRYTKSMGSLFMRPISERSSSLIIPSAFIPICFSSEDPLPVIAGPDSRGGDASFPVNAELFLSKLKILSRNSNVVKADQLPFVVLRDHGWFIIPSDQEEIVANLSTAEKDGSAAFEDEDDSSTANDGDDLADMDFIALSKSPNFTAGVYASHRDLLGRSLSPEATNRDSLKCVRSFTDGFAHSAAKKRAISSKLKMKASEVQPVAKHKITFLKCDEFKLTENKSNNIRFSALDSIIVKQDNHMQIPIPCRKLYDFIRSATEDTSIDQNAVVRMQISHVINERVSPISCRRLINFSVADTEHFNSEYEFNEKTHEHVWWNSYECAQASVSLKTDVGIEYSKMIDRRWARMNDNPISVINEGNGFLKFVDKFGDETSMEESQVVLDDEFKYPGKVMSPVNVRLSHMFILFKEVLKLKEAIIEFGFPREDDGNDIAMRYRIVPNADRNKRKWIINLCKGVIISDNLDEVPFDEDNGVTGSMKRKEEADRVSLDFMPLIKNIDKNGYVVAPFESNASSAAEPKLTSWTE